MTKLLHFVVTISIFLFIINSTSNALYINQLEMTVASVETCHRNLKVLPFSLNAVLSLISHVLFVFFLGTITVLVSDPIFARLAEIGNVDSAEAGTSISEEQFPTTDSDLNNDMSNVESAKKSRAPVKMTDLLLQRAAAKSAKKHGGTGVDEFMEEIPMQKQRRIARRKLFELPQRLKQTMGQANILWARGEIEQAKGICMELIRQGTEQFVV